MNSAISFSSPDSSGSDNIDWITPEGLYPDSGIQTDAEYESCLITSELMSELLPPEKQGGDRCSLSYSVDPSLPLYPQQHPHADYDPQTSSPLLGGHVPPPAAPYPFDTEQMRLVNIRREYQKILLDIEKKIIENKISWIDQTSLSDQIMMCQDPPCPILAPTPPATVPFSAPSDLSPDKLAPSFPIFRQDAHPPPHSPLNFVPQDSQTQTQQFPAHSKTHKTPVRRNSSSRMQPYFSRAPEDKEGVGEVGGVKKRQSHNAIEERYRKRINSRIQELKSIVAPDEPLPKSNILAKALTYIRDLEEKNRLLQAKVSELTGHPSPTKDAPSQTSSENSFHPKLSPSVSSPSNSPPLPPHKSRSSSAKLLLCFLTILLCFAAPDPVSIRELPSAFPSWDTVGGLGSAGFRSRTLLYFSGTPVTDTLQHSLSLLHPFTLLSWSVRLSLVCLSLGILAYSARVPIPRALSADHSRFCKLYSQAGVAFRENRLSQSLDHLETALGQMGVSVELSRGKVLLALFMGALYFSILKVIRSSYLRIFTRSHRDSDMNPSFIREVFLSLQLAQRVQLARERPLCSLYAALTAHSLALSHHSILPLYLLHHSHTALCSLLRTHSASLLDRCVLALVRRLTGSSGAASQQDWTGESLALWSQVSQEAGEWDLDQEIQTQVFCIEFTNLLKSAISSGTAQEQLPNCKLRFSSLAQSFVSTDELTRWWVTMGLFASDWKQGITAQHCGLLFKNIPPSLLSSSHILPKALVLTCKFRLSVHSSPLHRPSLLLRLSGEASELVWNSVQLDSPPSDNRDLFTLLQALCCEWVLDGLIQIWHKNTCVHIQHRTSQSYMSVLFILEKLAEANSQISNFSSHYSSSSNTLASSNPINQMDSIPQPVPTFNSMSATC